MLPEASEESSTKSNARNAFLELAKNRESQQTENIQIRQDKKEGPILDD